MFEIRVQIDKTEKHILQLINESKGENILEDETLINALETSKQETIEMKEKTLIIQDNQELINQTRNFYLSLA